MRFRWDNGQQLQALKRQMEALERQKANLARQIERLEKAQKNKGDSDEEEVEDLILELNDEPSVE